MNQPFELTLIALTVWGEARGESYSGKLAVAYVICNRMRRRDVRASRVVLQPYQFSFWNTDDPSRQKISDIDPNDPVWLECELAAAHAYFETQDDPTNGAEFYMNVPVVRQSRNGSLPGWWDTDATPEGEVVIGKHTFRRRR